MEVFLLAFHITKVASIFAQLSSIPIIEDRLGFTKLQVDEMT